MRLLTTLIIASVLFFIAIPTGLAKTPSQDFINIKNITIITPNLAVPNEIAKLSGVWDGAHRGKSIRAHRLFVQKINGNKALVTVALGTSVDGSKKFKPSTWSETAKVKRTKKGPIIKVKSPEDHIIRYTLVSENKIKIEITLKFRGGHMVRIHGQLVKMPTKTQAKK